MKTLISAIVIVLGFSAYAYGQSRVISNMPGRFQIERDANGGVWRIDTQEAHVWYCGRASDNGFSCVTVREPR